MDMDIKTLLNRSSAMTEKLQEQFKKNSKATTLVDTRFWNVARDTNGNGYAVIRFLPPPPNPDEPDGIEDAAFVKVLSYGFEGPGGWYINESPKTIGLSDPVSDYVSSLYKTKNQSNIEKAKKMRMRTQFISNVLVIDDPAHPENNGKVFLYKYGKSIFDMINDKLFPQFEDEVKMDAFDMINGANFKLKVRKVDGFPKYDKSEFSAPSKLYDGDLQKLEAVWKQCYSLKAFHAPDKFLSYEELETKMRKVLSLDGPSKYDRIVAEQASSSREELDDHVVESKPAAAPPKQVTTPSDEEDEMAFFKKIAAGR